MDILEAGDITAINANSIEEQYKQLVFESADIDYEITQDIVNEQGALLVPSGKSVDKNTYDKVLKHKLLKPIDDCLRFSNQITPASLLDDIATLCEQLLADTVYDFDSTMSTIRDIINECDYDSAILNKLTVLSTDRSENFNHSMSTAFVAIDIGKELKFPKPQLVDLFSAAVFHDIGEMFISPDLYDKDVLTNEEFKAVMVHPVVSHVILKESKTEFSASVLNAVLNHHEQIDGQGYPRRVSGEQVGQLERILSVADTFDALQRKKRSIDDIIWILKSQSAVNSITGEPVSPINDPMIVSALVRIIRNEQNSKPNPVRLENLQGLMKTLFDDLQSVTHDIEHLWKGIESALAQDTTGSKSGPLKQLHDDLYKLNYLILGSSGINLIEFNTISESERDLIGLRRDMERLSPEMLRKINTSREFIDSTLSEQDANIANEIARIQEKMLMFNRTLRKQIN